MQQPGEFENFALIRVLGVGGGGGNAVNRMIEAGIGGVEYAVINTDAQALLKSRSPIRVHIGEKSTRGLGAGGDPEVGEAAATESIGELRTILADADMVFITAGMGGGTGTGAAPILARLAREQGALTIGVVTRPFTFEGSRRAQYADRGIAELQENVDTLIVIPNDKLLEIADRRVSLTDSFRFADEVLRQGIQGISELITIPGLINLDFADVRAIMSEGGAALMAVGSGHGKDRARMAAEEAVSSRLLDVSIDGAQGILFNVTGGPDLTLFEVNQAAALVREKAHPDANVIFGAVIDDEMLDKMRITVIATGFERSDSRRRSVSEQYPRPMPSRPPPEPQPKPAEPKAPERHQAPPRNTQTAEPVKKEPEQPRFSADNLDIPAFLRRK